MAPTNEAVWLSAKKASTFEINPARYPTPNDYEVVVQSHAIALNLIDYAMQDAGHLVAPWVKYPFIPGSDVAGTVTEVGSKVTQFKTGDRVVGLATSVDKMSTGAREGGFQKFGVIQENCCSVIPDSLSYTDASVLPMGISTAASGLFTKEYCGLSYPTTNTKSTGQTFLVWGASTSVGCNAVQLVKAAGYEVVATTSSRNFEYIKQLGASHVFDYKDPKTPQAIIDLLTGTTCAGALAAGHGSSEACIDILGALPSSTCKRFVAQCTVPGGSPPKAKCEFVGFVAKYLANSASLALKARLNGVTLNLIWGTDLRNSEVGSAIFRDFLPLALSRGEYLAAPSAEVVGDGLVAIEGGLEKLRGGVSLKKLVVTI